MPIANNEDFETSIVDGVVKALQERLPGDWAVKSSREGPGVGFNPAAAAEAFVTLEPPAGAGLTLAVEAQKSFSPRDVTMLRSRSALLARMMHGGLPVLIAAPWLSQRSRELLENEGFSYLDLTGNMLLRLEDPAVYVRTTGSARNPEPAPRSSVRLTGTKASRLIRLLVDVRPPYGVRRLAGAAGLTPGYVSQLLDALDREALIERGARGRVESVDWPALLRRWAQSYEVFTANRLHTFVTPAGFQDVVDKLAGDPVPPYAITGSLAAAMFSPVTATEMVMAYCDEPAALAEKLEVLPIDSGADVVLLEPFDPVVWERTITIDAGLRLAAPSQVAVDCLTGNGRMPAEGEAVIEAIGDTEDAWRLASLEALEAKSS